MGVAFYVSSNDSRSYNESGFHHQCYKLPSQLVNARVEEVVLLVKGIPLV
jgi:hypothetical protein